MRDCKTVEDCCRGQMSKYVFIVQLQGEDGTPFKVEGIVVDRERITFQPNEDFIVASLKGKIMISSLQGKCHWVESKCTTLPRRQRRRRQQNGRVTRSQRNLLEENKHYGFIDLVGLEQQSVVPDVER